MQKALGNLFGFVVVLGQRQAVEPVNKGDYRGIFDYDSVKKRRCFGRESTARFVQLLVFLGALFKSGKSQLENCVPVRHNVVEVGPYRNRARFVHIVHFLFYFREYGFKNLGVPFVKGYRVGKAVYAPKTDKEVVLVYVNFCIFKDVFNRVCLCDRVRQVFCFFIEL